MTHPKENLPAQPATVVNILTAPAGSRWRYIGRAWPVKALPASRWANVFKITTDTPEERARALMAYVQQLNSSGLFYHVAELRGETLGCFCHPKPCHGHILATLANTIRLHGAKCPKCSARVKSSLMQRAKRFALAEYWHCPQCKSYGFQDRGTVELIPSHTPTLHLT